jgi:GWxTD domain-containing protein
MTPAERKLYQSLNQDERVSFRRAFWTNKSITEAQYFERTSYADTMFASGREGSGANTDQGRIYIANGAPSSTHRLPSSRIFVPCEVWYYDSLPQTGYRARLQFLFYRKAGAGDYRLYSPSLNSIRDLLVPQPGTRSMFPVNDIVTQNDIRNRLKYTPAEEEIVEAATGVARGVTGAENSDIVARATSVARMIAREGGSLTPHVESRLLPASAPQVRVLQFRVDGAPVVDVQVRVRASVSVALTLEDRGVVIERSRVPLGFDGPRSVLYTQRFFLLPGLYQLWIEADGARTGASVRVSQDSSQALIGEAFEEEPGELRFAITPDPRSADAREAIERQVRLRAAR